MNLARVVLDAKDFHIGNISRVDFGIESGNQRSEQHRDLHIPSTSRGGTAPTNNHVRAGEVNTRPPGFQRIHAKPQRRPLGYEFIGKCCAGSAKNTKREGRQEAPRLKPKSYGISWRLL